MRIEYLLLVNDMFSLAFANIVPLSQALELASKYTDETDPGTNIVYLILERYLPSVLFQFYLN
jgi:hypothetical protein